MPRDEDVLGWLADMRAVFEDDVPLLLRHLGRGELGPDGVRVLVYRWRRAGWVEVGRQRMGRPRVVALTTKGAAMVGVPGYRVLGEALHLHHSEVSRVRLWLGGLDGFGRWGRLTGWTAERDLRAGSYDPAGGTVHVADAVVEFEHGPGAVAVEVEVSGKTLGALDRAVEAVTLAYDAVVYFVGSTAIRDAVTRSVVRLTEEGRIPPERVTVMLAPTDPAIVR